MQCGERFGSAQHRNAGHGNGNKNPGGDRSGPTASQTGPPDASRPPWPPPLLGRVHFGRTDRCSVVHVVNFYLIIVPKKEGKLAIITENECTILRTDLAICHFWNM